MAYSQDKCTTPFEYNNNTNKCEYYMITNPEDCVPDDSNQILKYNAQTKLCEFRKEDGPTVISNIKTPICNSETIQMPDKKCKSKQPISIQEPNIQTQSNLQVTSSDSFQLTSSDSIQLPVDQQISSTNFLGQAKVHEKVQEPTNNTSYIFYIIIIFFIISIGFGVYYFRDKLFPSTTNTTKTTTTPSTTTTTTPISTTTSTPTPTTTTTTIPTSTK
jgi:hypothetical protein